MSVDIAVILQKKITAMKENDYYGHYKAFVNDLKHNPEQTLQIYCRVHGVVWRRLYDWLRRHHISLKRIYQTYRGASEDAGPDAVNDGSVEFRELIPKTVADMWETGLSSPGMTGGIRIDLPSGISISLEECSVAVLTGIINSLTGKEAADVLA